MSNVPIIDLYAALEPEALAAWLAERFSPRAARGEELLSAYRRFLQSTATGITSDDVTAKATDFAKMLKVEVKEIEATRVAIKEPVLAATRQIDGAGRKLSEPLVAASSEVEKRITAYLRIKEQEARRAAEEEAQRREAEAQALLDQAAEAEASGDIDGAAEIVEQAEAVGAAIATAAAVVEAPAQELTRVRTSIGSTTALRDNWLYRVKKITDVPAPYLQLNDAVIKAAIKSGVREIDGLEIYNEPKASVR